MAPLAHCIPECANLLIDPEYDPQLPGVEINPGVNELCISF